MQDAEGPLVDASKQVLADMAKPFEALPPTAVQWPNAEWFSATSGHVQKARADLAAAVGQALSSYQQSMANYVGAEAVQPTLDAVTALQARFRAVCAERGISEDDIERMQEDRQRVV